MKFLKLLFVLLVFTACRNKQFTDVDNPVPEDKIAGTRVEFNDIGGYTIIEDSLLGKSLVNTFLGSIYDPIFGRTDASFYMNFEMDGGVSNVDLGANPVIDSIVLYVKYSAPTYLDTTQKLKIQVYKVNDKLTADTKFNTKTKLAVGTNDIVVKADEMFDLDTKHVIIATDTVTGYLRIKLDANALWPDIQSSLTSTDVLQSSFKGIYVTTENSVFTANRKGAIASLNFSDNKSAMYCFYRSGTDTVTKKLPLTSRTASSRIFNQYSPVYMLGNTVSPNKTFTLDDSLNALNVNKKLYLQGFGGFGALLNLSGYCDNGTVPFTNFKTKGAANFFDSLRTKGEQIAINRALLILKSDPTVSEADFKRPFSLFLTMYDSTGNELPLDESLLDATGSYLRGQYDDLKKAYVFNITLTMQKLIARKLKINALRVIVGGANRIPNRVVLDIDRNGINKPELEIYYTKLQ
jgi:hypothetical protein